MKKRRAFALILTLFALILGLALPFMTASLHQLRLETHTWPLAASDAHYAYQGTLMNRVLALNAHLNGSPAVSAGSQMDTEIPGELWASLSSVLPVSGEAAAKAASFPLLPKDYAAEYRYIGIDYRQDVLSLHVVADAETGLPLRMELNCPPEMLSAWLEEHDLWEILNSYASLLNLGEATDDETTISSVLRSQSAQIRGTAFKATVTVIPAAGTLLLKLAASTPA